MSTPIEATVLRLLSAIEIDSEAAASTIEELGNEAVTVLCDVALGTFAGLRPKMRLNAAALLGSVDHPQAKETVHLLVRDENPDVSIRAVRAVARQKDATVVGDLDRILQMKTLSPLVAAETVKALIAIDSPDARRVLDNYDGADPSRYPHRSAEVVSSYLRTRTR